MSSTTGSPVNCATGTIGAAVVVGAGGEVVVVGAGAVVAGGASVTAVVLEVGDGDRTLVPAPLHAVVVNNKTQTGPKKRRGKEGKRTLNTNGFPTAENNPLACTICVPLGVRKPCV